MSTQYPKADFHAASFDVNMIRDGNIALITFASTDRTCAVTIARHILQNLQSRILKELTQSASFPSPR